MVCTAYAVIATIKFVSLGAAKIVCNNCLSLNGLYTLYVVHKTNDTKVKLFPRTIVHLSAKLMPNFYWEDE